MPFSGRRSSTAFMTCSTCGSMFNAAGSTWMGSSVGALTSKLCFQWRHSDLAGEVSKGNSSILVKTFLFCLCLCFEFARGVWREWLNTTAWYSCTLFSWVLQLELHMFPVSVMLLRTQETQETATEEDRGEDNKDPDWLIEQSIARQVAGGVVTLCNDDWKLLQSLQKVELSSSCNVTRNKNVARQVAEVTCYTVQFFSNLLRDKLLRKLQSVISP